MDTSTIIITAIIGTIIWALLLRWIIAEASRSAKIISYQEKQIRLLMLVCKKLGADNEEVDFAVHNKPVRPEEKTK